MKVVKYRKPKEEGVLIADFSILFDTQYGEIQINKLKFFNKAGQKWINFPCEKVEKDGEIKFFDYCSLSRQNHEIFRSDCLEAIERFCVEAGIEI